MPAKRSRSQALEPLKPQGLKIDFVILTDGAQVAGGKLYMLGGGWNLYRTDKYPVVFPFGLAIGILVPWPETNRKHSFSFTIRASEGAVLGQGQGDFEVGREVGIPSGMTQRVMLAVNGQLALPSAGTYEVLVAVPTDEKTVTFEALPPRKD